MSSATTPTTPDEPDDETVLEVEDLSITYRMDDEADVHAVQNVSFSIEAGTTFGLVGESGCGKTTAARSLIGLLDDNGEVTGGSVRKDGRDLTEVSDDELRAARWDEIATIPQNVMNALNPVETVGSQILDVIQLHTDRSQDEAKTHAEDLFEQVGLTPDRLNDYPHEFSGGMLQRAVIAMAMSCDPDLIIADEPTTALDVVVQDEILSELAELQAEMGVAVLVISHDIGVMAEICDDVGVMYAGELMEVGTAEEVFTDPSNPYTMGLANSFPDITDPDRDLVDIPGTAPELKGEHTGCPFVERCPFATEECESYRPELAAVDDGADPNAAGSDADGHRSRCHYVDDVERLREDAADPETWGGIAGGGDAVEPGDETVFAADGVKKYFDAESGLLDSILGREPTPVKAVDGVSFDVKEGEIFGIVGESGCGKSTLGRTMLNLHQPTEGTMSLDGEAIGDIPNEEFRRAAQVIFQDPFESLNPRMTIQQTLTEPLALLDDDLTYTERIEVARATLEEVGLSPAEEYLSRFPDQLSGGERQRVSIARALVVDPRFLLADEPVSMLDVSIRASVLNILRRLRRDEGLTLSIISHDLSLIRNVSDRTGVMYLGEFVETGDTDRIVEDPKHPYTKALVDSVPVPDPTVEREPAEIGGDPPSPRDPPSGCRFHTRCPAVIPPAEFEFADGRFRELMDLRQAIDAGTVRVARARQDSADPDDPASVADAIKARRFDGEFVDPEAESVVDDALTALADGDDGAAADRLEDAFTTPCELDRPELVEFEDGRQVACHLYD
ncbi:ABC transporter ATP-binding protein [Halolamina litorea]|uniref:dipeptide ABC transporter ATP-binding protein n=1 Tax=Halolamina litorea TaxID=1515593 RepID=UPI0022701604|nr:ABC transporter ATP-binding protein [Halolamina litorea]